MFATLDFQNQLNSGDIVVWNGTVTTWGIIRFIVCSGDMLRMADDEEIDHYKGTQNWGDTKALKAKLMGMIIKFININSPQPTHFKMLHAPDSEAWKWVPEQFAKECTLNSYVIDFYLGGKWCASKWMGTEDFEFPIAELLSVNLLKHYAL